MVEAIEVLERVSQIVSKAKDSSITQTPDGRDPVYWPITIHGATGMIRFDKETSPPNTSHHLSLSKMDN